MIPLILVLPWILLFPSNAFSRSSPLSFLRGEFELVGARVWVVGIPPISERGPRTAFLGSVTLLRKLRAEGEEIPEPSFSEMRVIGDHIVFPFFLTICRLYDSVLSSLWWFVPEFNWSFLIFYVIRPGENCVFFSLDECLVFGSLIFGRGFSLGFLS